MCGVWVKDSSLCFSPAPGSSDAIDALSNAAQIKGMPAILGRHRPSPLPKLGEGKCCEVLKTSNDAQNAFLRHAARLSDELPKKNSLRSVPRHHSDDRAGPEHGGGAVGG